MRLSTVIIPTPTMTPTPTPKPFDPNVGAVLPTHRVVAFYAIPGAEATGTSLSTHLNYVKQFACPGGGLSGTGSSSSCTTGHRSGCQCARRFSWTAGTYSHHLDPATIQAYIDFCQQNNLILFLDLDFGLAPVKQEVNFFLPYLERYSFVELAVDPEWMFPRHDGIPGINLSNVHASDLNPIIQACGGNSYEIPCATQNPVDCINIVPMGMAWKIPIMPEWRRLPINGICSTIRASM